MGCKYLRNTVHDQNKQMNEWSDKKEWGEKGIRFGYPWRFPLCMFSGLLHHVLGFIITLSLVILFQSKQLNITVCNIQSYEQLALSCISIFVYCLVLVYFVLFLFFVYFCFCFVCFVLLVCLFGWLFYYSVFAEIKHEYWKKPRFEKEILIKTKKLDICFKLWKHYDSGELDATRIQTLFKDWLSVQLFPYFANILRFFL